MLQRLSVTLGPAIGRLESGIDRHPVLVSIALFVLHCLQAAGRSPGKLFWNDEYLVYLTARLDSFTTIWQSLRDAPLPVDPPLYHFLTHLCMRLPVAAELAARLPSLIGFGVMEVCLFLALRPRIGAAAALLAAVFPTAAPIQSYQVEARPYGFLLGCIAFSFWMWTIATSRTTKRFWPLAGLTAGLAAALLTHYFATLAVACFGVAEAFRSLRRKKIDFAVWSSMAAGCAVVIVYLPLLHSAALYRSWSANIVEAVDGRETLLSYAFWAVGPLLLPALLCAAVWKWRRAQEPVRPGLATHEMFLGFCLAALPVAGYLIGILVKHFTARYTLGFIVGVAILVGAVVERFDRRYAGYAVTAALVFLLFGARSGLLHWVRSARPASAAVTALDSPALQRYGSLPIAVEENERFFEVQLYGNPTWKHRVSAVVDLESIDRGTTNFEQAALISLYEWNRRGWVSLPMQPLAEFTRRNRQFLFWGDRYVDAFRRSGDTVEFLGPMGGGNLYLVTAPGL